MKPAPSIEPVEIDQENPPNPERRGLKKGLYLIPFSFTTANILMGFMSIMESMRAFQILSGRTATSFAQASVHFDLAAVMIGFAVVFDALDGRIARLTKTTTEIGVQFDSIADVLTFGISPAVLVFSWCYGSALPEGSSMWKLGWFVSFLYLMCGAFRLARYNVQAMRPRLIAEGVTKVDKKNFVGLPIPAAAAALAAIIHFHPEPIARYGQPRLMILSGLIMALVACLGILMVSTIRYSSFKSVGAGRANVRLVILATTLGVGIWLFSQYVLLVLVSAYVLHGIVFKLWSLVRPRPIELGQPTEVELP
ncbi:MAG: CDP-alcohol phosphatidyltransferase family protein [Pyrinomonadaceae bacterium]